MGYAGSTLQPGYTLVTPQFTAIGGEDIDVVGGLKAVGTSADGVAMSILDEFGTPTATYMWNTWMWGEGCWVDPGTFQKIATQPIVTGQALWVQGASAEQDVQSSGEVGKEDALIRLQAGYTIGGNPFPVAIPLQEVLAEGTSADGVALSILDEFGTPTETYMWNTWMWGKGCWVNPGTFAEIVGISIPAGQGLWIQGASSEQFVRFPAPEL